MNKPDHVSNFIEVYPDPTLNTSSDPIYADIARVLNGNEVTEYEDSISLNDQIIAPIENGNKVTVKDIFNAIGDDFNASPSRLRSFSGALMVLISQATDRARISVIVTPAAATYAMEHIIPYGNNIATPLVTAAAAAVTFFGVNAAIAESLNQGIEHFPLTTGKFEEKFPKVIAGFTDSLAGVDSRETRAERMSNGVQIDTSFKEKIRIHAKRATTIIGIGPTPYVATSAVNGYNLEERRNLHLAAIADTSVLAGAIGLGLSETIIQLVEHGHADQAQHVQDIVGYTPLWLGIAGLSVVSELASKRIQKRKEAKTIEKVESIAE